MDISTTFLNTVKSRRLLVRGERVAIAVSGGVDSSVLLHIMLGLRERLGIELSVCHLNHNLRGKESLRDQRFVEKAAKKHALAFYARTLPLGSLKADSSVSLQESARKARYAFFAEAKKELKADKVALAHNMDDQAQTLLMRFLSGTSLKGLGGIPYKRSAFVRPFLDVSREEIEGYAKDEGLRFVEDSSNESSKYLRNRVRQELLPLIVKSFNPNVIETLSKSANIFREDSDCLDLLATTAFADVVTLGSCGDAELDCRALRSMHRAIASRVIVSVFAKVAPGVRLYGNHVESIMKLYDGKRPNASLALPGGIIVAREYECIKVASGKPDKGGFSMPIEVPGAICIGPANVSIEAKVVKRPVSFKSSPDTAYFDLGIMDKHLVARRFEPGDVFSPFGMKGRKKLKELFIDAKLPASKRREVPVVVAGDEIVWVAGLRRSSLYLPEGARALRLKLISSVSF